MPEEDATAKLCALEKKLNAKLALLDKIQSHDIYTCCWNGHTDLVQCHISFSSQLATVRERNNLRRARRAMALESAEEKLAELQAEVSAAEKAAQFASEKAARDAANAVDETEFGEGYRPLHYAAYAGHSETVRALLRCGADARAKNSAGCTALFLASQQGKHDVVRVSKSSYSSHHLAAGAPRPFTRLV